MINEELKIIYKKMFDYYLSISSIGAQAFDKAILGLSTASLGFTIAILNSIHKTINHPKLLWFSWAFLIISIASTLATFIILQKHASHRINFYSSEIIENNEDNSRGHWTDCILSKLQYACVFSFALGLILFVLFVSYQY